MLASIFWNTIGIIIGLVLIAGFYLNTERYKSFMVFFTIAVLFFLYVNDCSIGASVFMTSVADLLIHVVFDSVFCPEAHRKSEEEAAKRREWNARHCGVSESEMQAREAGRWAAFYMKH